MRIARWSAIQTVASRSQTPGAPRTDLSNRILPRVGACNVRTEGRRERRVQDPRTSSRAGRRPDESVHPGQVSRPIASQFTQPASNTETLDHISLKHPKGRIVPVREDRYV